MQQAMELTDMQQKKRMMGNNDQIPLNTSVCSPMMNTTFAISSINQPNYVMSGVNQWLGRYMFFEVRGLFLHFYRPVAIQKPPFMGLVN